MRTIVISMVLMLSVVSRAHSQSQSAPTTPAYWVIETNVHHRDCTIVKFYDNQNQLVHEVKIMGVYIDIRVPRQKRKLDELLKNHNKRSPLTSNNDQKRREKGVSRILF